MTARESFHGVGVALLVGAVGVVALAAGGCGAGRAHGGRAGAEAGPRVEYLVTLPARADGAVRVEACSVGFESAAWEPIGFSSPRIEGEERRGASCVAYRALAGGREHPWLPAHGRDAYYGGHGSVFLRPENVPNGTTAEIRFEAPEGVEYASAWVTGTGLARAEPSFFMRESQLAYGPGLRVRREELSGVSVTLARLPGPLAVTDAELADWLRASLEAAKGLTGAFPRERLEVLVVPVEGAPGPVPFGLVRRGGGPSVMLLVSDDATIEELMADWVAVHELFHLVMPPIDRRDAWLSEGFATYYQELLRARAGRIPPDEALRRLAEGIARGRAYDSDLPLGEESARMRSTSAYTRVYWAGAAFALAADVALRQRGSSLDALMARLLEGSRGAERSLDAQAFLAQLEEPLGEAWLTERARAFKASREFPDVSEALRALGLSVEADGSVRFDESGRALRRALSEPPTGR